MPFAVPQSATGTYVAVRPTGATLMLLEEWAVKNNVVLDDDLHVTVLYSRAVVNFDPLMDEHLCTPLKFSVLGPSLVVELDAPTISARHAQLIAQGGTHDFPTFIPHISICKELTRINELPLPEFGMTFGLERAVPLDLDRYEKAFNLK